MPWKFGTIWCYDLLTDRDKKQIVAGVEHKVLSGENDRGAKMAYRFRLLWRGRLLEVKVDQTGAHYRLLRGDALTIKSNGQEITVE